MPSQLLPASVMPITTRPVGWRWREAVELYVSPLPDDQRPDVADDLLRNTKSGVVSLRPSRIVLEKRVLVGCVIAAQQLDLSWHLQMPVVAETISDDAARDEIRRTLMTDLASDFDESDSWISQILLTHEQASDGQLLSDCGFPVLTELIFMSAQAITETRPQQDNEKWMSESWSESIRTRFESVIVSTYEGTLDCPELNGRRSGEQAVLGHEISGPFQAEMWKVYSSGKTDAGIVLARCHPEKPSPVIELVYFGVSPGFRNRGLGQKMLADLFDEARRRDVPEIMLAVDVRNEPAIRLYEQFGFREFDRRRVHARLR